MTLNLTRNSNNSGNEFLNEFSIFHWNLNSIYVMLCAFWYRLYNFKEVKNTHGRVLLSECNIPPWVISYFSNCTNGAKPHKQHICSQGCQSISPLCCNSQVWYYLYTRNFWNSTSSHQNKKTLGPFCHKKYFW